MGIKSDIKAPELLKLEKGHILFQRQIQTRMEDNSYKILEQNTAMMFRSNSKVRHQTKNQMEYCH